MKMLILDRDGVINYDRDDYIKNADELELIPESLQAIAILTQLDYTMVVCTNQSGIGRELFTVVDLNLIHDKMLKAIEFAGGKIAAIFVCPHHPDDNCECRKPKPQMIFDICDRFNIEDVSEVTMIGDSLRDLEAISQAGGNPIWVKTGNKTIAKSKLPKGTLVFDSLLAFAESLVVTEEEEELHEHQA